jgi:hypothetical protein
MVATNIIGALHLCFSDYEKTGRNPAWKESIRQKSSFRSANIGRKNPIKPGTGAAHRNIQLSAYQVVMILKSIFQPIDYQSLKKLCA